MGLTDTATLWLFATATIAVFLVSVLLTVRLRHPWLGPIARGGLILLVAALSLATTGVYLNDSNGWYTSWADLGGATGSQQTALRGSKPDQAAAGRSAVAGAVSHSALPALPSPGSRTQTYSYHGPHSGVTAQIVVYLPASYQSAAGANEHYPVIEALHGFPGTPSGWTKTMGMEQTMDTLVARGRIRAPIVLVPQIDVPLDQDGECVDGTTGPKLETWVTKDVPDFAATHFRVDVDRSAWATMGYSAGGWCSAMAGMLHPDTYGAAIVLSGYFAPDFGEGAGASLSSPRYNLAKVAKSDPPAVALWVQTGRKSPYWPDNKAFFAAVRSPTSITTVIQADTGHRWSVWKAELPTALTWLGSHLPGFAAA